MSFKLKGILWMLIFIKIQCSRVYDGHDRKIIVDEYCNKFGACPDGTHVMCTYYNPDRVMGPRCADTQNVTMTQELADIILRIMNKIRSKVANGLAVASEPLPRGYGILRLQWDYELATFAQLYANQCMFGKDRCRATKRFSDPGQLLGLTLFLEPQWFPLSKKDLFKYEGFSTEKLKYGILSSMRWWYLTKNYIHPDDILGIERWPEDLDTTYLQIIEGSVSHIGCGVAAYKVIRDYDLGVYNIVRIVCNFSNRVLEHDGIYNIDPPSEVGYTVKCGCPPGYDEDEDCLCYESGRNLPHSCRDGLCTPRVVVVPIISVEDAPARLLKNESNHEKVEKEKSSKIRDSHIIKYRPRPSVFTKSSIFQLPTKRMMPKPEPIIKKNVRPRKDFSNLTDIVSSYLNKRKYNNIVRNKNNKSIVPFKHIDKNNNMDNIGKQNIRDNNSSTTINPTKNFVKERIKDLDNKLINLLNKLEEEAKDTQLADTKRDIVDKKIKRIYETFVQKFHSNYENEKLNEYEDDIQAIQAKIFNDIVYNHVPLTENDFLIKKHTDQSDRNMYIGNSEELKSTRKFINHEMK